MMKPTQLCDEPNFIYTNLIYKGKLRNKTVNIFQKNIYCVTVLFSTCCKTYCFAL